MARPNVSSDRVHGRLADRLRPHWTELEQETLTRVYAISDPTATSDPAYSSGLRTSVYAALEYGLDALAARADHAKPVPVLLLAQARTAARRGVSLDTVMRRYFAGYRLFADLLVSEFADGDADEKGDLRRLFETLAVTFDRLIAAISDEFCREARARPGGSEQRRTERIRGLLDGEFHDYSALTSELAYDFDAIHLGVLAVGPSADEAVRSLATALDARPLVMSRPEQTVWAWFGARYNFDPLELESLVSTARSLDLTVAIGEPWEGLAGWRLTHRQAAAALPVALRESSRVARYSDVALIAAIYRDELLATSLRRLLLEPLETGRDGGASARETLQAYVDAGRNASSAAALLGISRHTAASRIRAIETRLGRPLAPCLAQLEVALKLDELCNQVPGQD